MRVELLLVEDCPHAGAARRLLARSLGAVGGAVEVVERVGDYPSPTILINGVDVMTGQVGVARVHACRLDVPTEAAVIAALRSAVEDDRSGEDDAYPAQLAVGVTSDRLAQVSARARALHRAILSGFSGTGRAPDRQALAAALPAERGVALLLGELHDRDVIRLGDDGSIRAAYPFSGVPTAHTVAIEGGPTVYAMCAIDALGIAEMLDRAVIVSSADPLSGAPVRVSVGKGQSMWSPDTAVVVVGSETAPAPAGCCPPAHTVGCAAPAADRCCGVMNFFTSHDNAERWLAARPTVSGIVLTQGQAVRLGVDIFGRLLADEARPLKA
jgi:hypothetical protein